MKGSSVLLVVLCLLASRVSATVLRVEADGSGEYATIQAAMNHAAPGDTVQLGNGVYRGSGNRAISFQWVLLRSAGHDPLVCRIDGEGYALGSLSGTGTLTLDSIGILDCRRLTGSVVGTAVFRDCRFTECAGIASLNSWLESSSVWLDDCLVLDCYTSLLDADEVRIDGCRFESNRDPISVSGHVSCRDSEFVGNMGALLMEHIWDVTGASALYERCWFLNNATQNLIVLGEVSAIFRYCRFKGNAGAVILQDWPFGYFYLSIEGCSFAGNSAGAPACVVFGPETYGELNLTRSLFAWQASAQLFELGQNAPVPTLTECDLFGNTGGDWTGAIADQYGVGCNMSADPIFCNWYAGDLTLGEDSPCLPENNACGVLIGASGQGCGDPAAMDSASEGMLPLSAQPSPFRAHTRLTFSLSEPARVTLAVYDAAGRCKEVLLDDVQRPAGTHRVDWDARDLPNGMYLARLRAGVVAAHVKLILLR